MVVSNQIEKLKSLFVLIIISCVFLSTYAQTTVDSTAKNQFNKKRFTLVVATEAVGVTGSLIALNQLWYSDFERSSFRFFDDTKEWRGMDKAGHFTTSYYMGRTGISLYRWTGMKDKKAIWYGGLIGFGYLSAIEIMDGYSSQWGFSVSDFTANALGSFTVIGQELLWKEQRITFKYSVRMSPYAKYRPNLLGTNFQERILKDYNGQTYWLSANVASFMKEDTHFPKWLNVALGYGAEGMTGGHSNPLYLDENGKPVNFERYSQFYLSLDVDLSRINTKSAVLKTLFGTIGFLKFPFPAIELNKKGVNAQWLGF